MSESTKKKNNCLAKRQYEKRWVYQTADVAIEELWKSMSVNLTSERRDTPIYSVETIDRHLAVNKMFLAL